MGGCGTFVPDSEVSAEVNAARLVQEYGLDDGADVVMEASGAESSVQSGIHVLRVGGSYVQGGLGWNTISFAIVVMASRQ